MYSRFLRSPFPRSITWVILHALKDFSYNDLYFLFSAELATGESGGNGDHSQTTIMGPMAMEVDPSKMEEAADDQINTLEVYPLHWFFFSKTKARTSRLTCWTFFSFGWLHKNCSVAW